jgi:hypothetical protein
MELNIKNRNESNIKDLTFDDPENHESDPNDIPVVKVL